MFVHFWVQVLGVASMAPLTSCLPFVASSMTELEKDIGSLKSGLKCVEAVSNFSTCPQS